MPQVYEHSFSGNYPVVAAQNMKQRALKEMFWGPFIGHSTPKAAPVNMNNKPTTTKNVIVVQSELKKKAGDMIEIPVHRNLVTLPKTGASQLEGLEERPNVNFAQVPIMLQRHAENPQNNDMEGQVTKDVDLVKNSRPALQDHYTRVSEYLGASYALYHGYSWNIFDSGWFDSNSKISQVGNVGVSHPHIYCAGSGKVSYGSGYPGTAAYETEAGTDITAVGATDVMDAAYLQALKADPQVRRITPIVVKNGNPLRLLIAHPWQIVTLENDSTFQTIVSRAYVQQLAKDNPFLIGCKYIYGGFAIYESDTAVFQTDVSSGAPLWGPATVTDLDSFEDYSSATRFGALILGANALFKGEGSSMRFKKMTKDYGQYIGIAYQIMEGYSRADFWNRDDGTTGSNLINDSSAIAVTYAAQPTY